VKKELEAKLTGKHQAPSDQTISDAIDLFVKEKTGQGVTTKVIDKYRRELARLRQFCDGRGAFHVRDLTRELLTHFIATWPELYPAATTRSRVRDRLRTFLKYCYQCEWISRVPETPKIIVKKTDTLPLTKEEYAHLLDTTFATFADDAAKRQKIHALLQTMRWTGLSINDALTLSRSELLLDRAKRVHRVVTARQKTGEHVSVPIPNQVASEILAVANGHPRYLFWTGNGLEESAVKNMQKNIKKLFDDAGLTIGYMRSHRLRDTFACELLTKGVPLEEVSRLLGHSSIKTTERSYAAWVRSRQDRADSLVMATWAS